jgi:threonine/homoserine/homoserine lactone efflux protein
MLAVIGQLLPLALAVALSTVPITAVLTILLSPGSRAGLPFMLGFLVGNIIVTTAFSLGLRAVPRPASKNTQVEFAIFELVLGAALIAYAVVVFARRRTSGPRDELPRWLRAVGNIRPGPAAGLGVLLTIRPKSLLLGAAAGLAIGPAHLSPGEFVVCIIVFIVIGTCTVTVPVIITLSRPATARRPLRAAERWIAHNSRTVTILVALVIGTVLIGNGLTRF